MPSRGSIWSVIAGPKACAGCNVVSWERYIYSLFSDTFVNSMLDLAFVRDNLPLVEEKLRQRGMDPAEVLRDFRQIDTQRRQLITETETLKARRNRASEDIAKLKKSGQDAGALIAETKDQREKIQEQEKAAEDYDNRLRQLLAGIPNIP